MSAKKEFVERREHQRFKIKAIARPVNMKKIGRIVDISLGGFAYRYVGNEGGWPNNLFQLGKLFGRAGENFNNVPLKTTSDIKLTDTAFTTRRRCIQFGELTPRQVEALKKFISNNTTEMQGV